MNTGIQEALNLGWKIARTLAGNAPDRLLDTYHAERHPIERDVLRQSSLLTQMASAEYGLSRARLDANSVIVLHAAIFCVDRMNLETVFIVPLRILCATPLRADVVL